MHAETKRAHANELFVLLSDKLHTASGTKRLRFLMSLPQIGAKIKSHGEVASRDTKALSACELPIRGSLGTLIVDTMCPPIF